jgi:phospholipase C
MGKCMSSFVPSRPALRTFVRLRTLCAAALTAILAGCGSGVVSSGVIPAATVFSKYPIQHIVIIMQENRTPDNLFNGFPGADTVQTGMSNGKSVPLTPVSLTAPYDLDHSHVGWWRDWNNGKMDGFTSNGYAYVPRSETTAYWTLAQRYTLGDRMFQSNTGPSFAAHQYMIAAQAGNASENPSSSIWGCDASSDSRVTLVGPNGTDLPGVYPCFDYQTMADLLDAKAITWRYYAPGDGEDWFYILSAFQAVRHIRYGSDWKNNIISPETNILTDVANGQLAQVSWVVPTLAHSDHPGSGTTEGPDWVASIINTIGASKYWDSTAIFVSWDDWGGWYDHVVPPQVDSMGLGFRVPLLVVSPYARHGYVSHVTHEFSGFLSFIETIYALPNLGARDATTDNLWDCFDFTQTPKPYTRIPTKLSAEDLIREKASGPPDDD